MTLRTIGLILLVGSLLLVGYLGIDIADAQTSQLRLAAEAQYTAGGTKQCLTCHGGETMTIMAETVHGNLENPHSPYSQQGCESCHGAGSVHVSRSGGGAGRPILLSFKGTQNVPEQNAACQNCHAETLGALEGFDWADSLHETADLSCQDCHQSHSTERPMQDQAQQLANCSGCHRRQIDDHPRFENAGIVFDSLSCGTCHAVHELEGEH